VGLKGASTPRAKTKFPRYSRNLPNFVLGILREYGLSPALSGNSVSDRTVLVANWGLLESTHFPCKPLQSKRADERTRTADLLITSALLKSRESEQRCFFLLLVSQHSIRRNPLEAHLSRAFGQQGAEP